MSVNSSGRSAESRTARLVHDDDHGERRQRHQQAGRAKDCERKTFPRYLRGWDRQRAPELHRREVRTRGGRKIGWRDEDELRAELLERADVVRELHDDPPIVAPG